ncbi:APC family permease [Hoeflea prorocentri]|uniref:APC family permease n=1 Tax=Hoeflea prorocentri TaxID=1922333 RepID=A0A9X3ZIZ1_9HYPH|nr:APC family permease [Hoeflea prorocentri]MCY6383412.1 APC family permease [Hoeflea prorocentri]MDA5401212.1 APC family permease [Hoeflea prorocentri]
MAEQNTLKREIGLVGLIALGVSGIIGSGWLFAPLLASQLAGPAAIIAWLVGSLAMLALALTFAEISAMFPLPGGIASIPQVTHGNVVSIAMGWTAWLGYLLTAPVEVEATLRYLAPYAPWIFKGPAYETLTYPGSLAALGFMALFVVLNALGVRLFTLINTSVTWVKVIVPVVITGMFIASSFEPSNFTSTGGFAPYGTVGILSAVSSGGVILSMIGFRHAIDMAGEVRNPGRNVPLAMIAAMLICLLIYMGLQIAFIGALSPADLSGGWASLHFTHKGGPLASIATALGLLWLVSLMNTTAIISPFGSALVAVGANARLVLALTHTRFMPQIFASLSSFGVPLNALLMNLVIGWVAVLFLNFSQLVATHSSLVVLSFIVGPIAVVALRTLASGYNRPFRLPAVSVFGYTTFILATLIVYWSGWHTVKVLGLAMLVGAVLFFVRLRSMNREELNLRQAAWLLPYIAGLGVLSWLGSFGGLGVISQGYDIAACAAFSAVIFYMAVRCALTQAEFDEQTDDILDRIGYDEAIIRDLEV